LVAIVLVLDALSGLAALQPRPLRLELSGHDGSFTIHPIADRPPGVSPAMRSVCGDAIWTRSAVARPPGSCPCRR
jgi:hypothetical protein